MIADTFDFLTGPVTLVVSIVVLLLTGVFVYHFVGDQIIISGIKRGKKLTEKTEDEIIEETATLGEIRALLERIDKRLNEHNIKPEDK